MSSEKICFVTPHLNCLTETVQMRDHNISFHREIGKAIAELSSKPVLVGFIIILILFTTVSI